MGAGTGPEQKPRVLFFCCGPGERQGKEKRRWAPARGQSKKINTTQGVCFLLRPKAREGEAPLGAGTGPEQKKKHHPGCCFFFCSGPGERQGKEKPRWAPARGQSKKKNTTHGDLFFWLRPLRKAGEGEAPLGAGTGPEEKKHHPGCVCVCVCCGPGERQGKEKPRWAPAWGRPEQKKKNTQGVFAFFLLRPRQKAGEGGRRDLSAGPEQKKNHDPGCVFWSGPAGWQGKGCFFFCCGPFLGWCLPLAGVVFFFLLRPRPDRGGVFFFAVAPPRRSLTHCGLGRFRQGSGGVFFFCCGPARSFLVSLKRPAGAAAKKNKHHGAVFFFLLRPRADAHSLTAGLGGAYPSPGWCFFFCCGPARTGVVFFFCCGRARTLTHSLRAGAISARPGWCFFFLLRPRLVFLGNSKKCLVYYIGSKKTRRGHNKKKTPLPAGPQQKKHHGAVFFFCCGPARTLTHSLRARVVPPPRRGGVFFLLRPRPDRGGVFVFAVAPPRRSLTHCGLGRFRQGSGGVFFFCCGPARSFLVSLKRPGGAAAQKKTPRGGVFFLLRPRADAHSLTAGLGGASPSPGWCLFFCCGPARTGVVFFFFAVAAPGRSLTHCGLGRFRQGPGGVFFFCCGPARTLTHSLRAWVVPPPRRGGVFFFCCGPARTGWCFFFCCGPAQTLTHSLWAGAISARPDGVFLFCCGPAGSFLVSLKRPGGAAAKKKTPRGGVFFFAAAPRGRSLTHCGPGWCLPLAGVVCFFFFAAATPGPGWCFFFAVAPPRRSLTHCGLGRFRQGSGGVFFFAVAPPGLFWLV